MEIGSEFLRAAEMINDHSDGMDRKGLAAAPIGLAGAAPRWARRRRAAAAAPPRASPPMELIMQSTPCLGLNSRPTKL